MNVSIGSDERSHTTDVIIKFLFEKGCKVTQYGAISNAPTKENSQWVNVAKSVAMDIKQGIAEFGILFCYTGTGVCMVANKFSSVRAALCVDAETARGARLWNDANVLVMSLRLTSETIAKEIVTAWFESSPSTGQETLYNLSLLKKLD